MVQAKAEQLQLVFGTQGDDMITAAAKERVFAGAGSDLVQVLEGSDGADLHGGTGEDTLRAYTDYRTLSDGNLFIGGTGGDRYEIEVIGDIYGGGHTIREQGSAGETDTLRFFGGASPGDMRVIRDGHSLYMHQGEYGVTVNIEHFFDNAGYRIERFEFEDGTVWTDKEVEQMALAMAGSTGAGGSGQAQAALEDFPNILLASSPMIP
ncbi:calcium-binding protein [Paenibacillus mucilaginosus]|uniref:Bacteriocin n=1 Tax=Paenibacillus mucilaginosus (strain KNP414) TaxID=1036673 RepID=F8FHY7_PAEMK|nr:calcium-binding protein [Paenibacillus mucilaginosus]AEI43329.1 bacteriocin [Paenibacillus mucilaginosus KNP414]MCG7212118.1 bacteriocin [Paenibacillus mucilaginosus]WDM24907.1 bacteriocin [Paenibacillus mucilaginosus]